MTTSTTWLLNQQCSISVITAAPPITITIFVVCRDRVSPSWSHTVSFWLLASIITALASVCPIAHQQFHRHIINNTHQQYHHRQPPPASLQACLPAQLLASSPPLPARLTAASCWAQVRRLPPHRPPEQRTPRAAVVASARAVPAHCLPLLPATGMSHHAWPGYFISVFHILPANHK